MSQSPAAPGITGFTIQVYVPAAEIDSARAFYSRLFDRDPDFAPHDDFLEWALITGQEIWFQVVGRDTPSPLVNRVRFRVEDIREAIEYIDELGIKRSEPSVLPGVVAFVDFTDRWDNSLGFYQDLVPTSEQMVYPGTSVADETLFEKLD